MWTSTASGACLRTEGRLQKTALQSEGCELSTVRKLSHTYSIYSVFFMETNKMPLK